VILNGKFHNIRSAGNPKSKMEGHHPEVCITDPRNMMTEEMNWR
jgi:hypothetical protein